jgi:hypothetical protein
MAGVASVRSGIEAHCHSVYYRAMKKTLTPLADVYMRALLHMQRPYDDMFNQHDNALNTLAATQHAPIVRAAKHSMK